MTTYIAVCLTLLVLEFALAIAFLIAALVAIRQAARAFETLAYRVDEQVDQVGTMMQSGWMRGLQALAGILGGFWSSRRRPEE